MIKSTIVAGMGGFIANMAGCFLIGLFYGWVSKRSFMTKQLSIFLITGLCGGFTTFSTFSHDMIILLQKREWIKFLLYIIPTGALGLLAVWLGMQI